jgi:hypothetical protein
MTDPFANMLAPIYRTMGKDAEYEGQDEERMVRIIISHDLSQWGDQIDVQSGQAVIAVRRVELNDRPRRGDIFRLETSREYIVDRVILSDELEHRCLCVEGDDD